MLPVKPGCTARGADVTSRLETYPLYRHSGALPEPIDAESVLTSTHVYITVGNLVTPRGHSAQSIVEVRSASYGLDLHINYQVMQARSGSAMTALR